MTRLDDPGEPGGAKEPPVSPHRFPSSDLHRRLFRWLRADRRRLAAALIAALVPLLALAGVVYVVASGGGDDEGDAVQQPTPTPAPLQCASPDLIDPLADDGPSDWEDIEVPERTECFRMTASDTGDLGVPTGTSFTIEALEPIDATAIAARLSVEPQIAFDVEALDDGQTGLAPGRSEAAARFRIQPRTPLADDTLYRFTLLDEPAGMALGTWAFQTQRPLRVVQTLPGDQTTNVPTNIGIEVTFSQDGVTGVQENFSIVPNVSGRFEVHKRTVVFVPDSLAEGALYTVTIGAAVGIEGSGLTLRSPHVFQFETGSGRTGATPGGGPALMFTRRVWEAAPAEKPAVALFATYYSDTPANPGDTPLPFTVYALGEQQAFLDAINTFSATPPWAQVSRSRHLLDTSGLQEVASFQSALTPMGETTDYYVVFPDTLPTGYYLVQTAFEGQPTQTLLQVTEIAAYASISERRLLVWANDLATKTPVSGASIAVAGSAPAATTGADGVAMFEPPEGLIELHPSPWGYVTRETVGNLVLTASDGRSVVVPLADIFNGYRYFGFREYTYFGDPGYYWHYLYTDRHTYRMTDSVNFWGVVREREKLPASLDVTIEVTGTSYGENGSYTETLLARTSVQTTDTGTYIGKLPLKGVSPGYYQMEARIGDQVVDSTYIEVRDFVKPAYEIQVLPEKRAIFAGEGTDVLIKATFFDGAPVPNLELQYNQKGAGETVTTDSAGEVLVPYDAARPPEIGFSGYGPYSTTFLDARPVLAEEGEIHAYTELLVFSSAVTLDATTAFDGTAATVSGTAYNVDLTAINSDDPLAWKELEYGSTLPDYHGTPASGREITADVTETSWVATETGTVYDFIAKIVRKTYRYSEVRTPIGTFTTVTDGSGRFQFSFPAAADRSYQAELAARDDAGRRQVTTAWLSTGAGYYSYNPGPEVVDARDGACTSSLKDWTGTCPYAPGDEVSVAVRERDQDLPAGGDNRYIFYLAQNGIRSYAIGDSPAYAFTFAEEHVPNVAVLAARFTGHTYQEASSPYIARFDSSLRNLNITVTPDKERYGPGDTATLGVAVTDKAGQPVQAEVLLSAVDEAIFSLRSWTYYFEMDPLSSLYRQVPSGVLHTYASHQYPYTADQAERGGDGPRDEFKDTALFDRVVTDSSGHGSITFQLPDNLTSWRVTALAVSPSLYAGSTVANVPVSLPVFVDVTMNSSYLTTDRPNLKLRAFGTALSPGDPVTFEVTSPTLLTQPLTASGTAFEPVELPLPALTEGRHEVTFRVTGAGYEDAVVRTTTVVASRLLRSTERYHTVSAGGSLTPEGASDGTTRVTVSDFNRGRYYPALRNLSWTWGDRVDQMLARNISQQLLEQYFEETSYFPAEFQPSAYQKQDGGIAIFPFADDDLVISARVASLAADQFGRQGLVAYFQSVLDDPEATRERTVVALFGMAALGEPALPSIQALAGESDLTVREQLYLGLAAAELGDFDTARAIYAGLVEEYGQRRGPDARLNTGDDQDDILEATSLAAELGAALADDRAPLFFGYTQQNWTRDILVELEQISYLARVLPNLSAAPVRFAYTFAGERQEKTLDHGRGFGLLLTPEELASLDLQSIEGTLGVTSAFLAPFDPSSITPDPDISVTRSYTGQSGDQVSVKEGDIVSITLSFSIGGQAVDGCYQITDILPSGLRPTTPQYAWDKPDNAAYPYNVQGQRVSYCVGKGWPTPAITYYARVAGTGNYTVEPAIIQSQRAPDSIAVTGSLQMEIR